MKDRGRQITEGHAVNVISLKAHFQQGAITFLRHNRKGPIAQLGSLL